MYIFDEESFVKEVQEILSRENLNELLIYVRKNKFLTRATLVTLSNEELGEFPLSDTFNVNTLKLLFELRGFSVEIRDLNVFKEKEIYINYKGLDKSLESLRKALAGIIDIEFDIHMNFSGSSIILDLYASNLTADELEKIVNVMSKAKLEFKKIAIVDYRFSFVFSIQ